MAITFFGGPPGAGKSYALVEQVIVPAVLAGRRVLTNVEGVDPDKIWRYCTAKSDEPSRVGHVVNFDGRTATEPGFFPTDAISDENTVLKGGDLLVFDEWRLYWPKRGKLPSEDLEPFLRWHRHLSNPAGTTCDVAIASQLPTDVHQDFRGLIERSYKFKKLKAVGLSKAYAWDVYEGHLQPKGGRYAKGNGTYKDEITALYRSYSGDKQATELNTDGRASIIGKSLYVMLALGLIALAFSVWGVSRFFSGASPVVKPPGGIVTPGNATGGVVVSQSQQPTSDFRIVGHVTGDQGVRVVVASKTGAVRLMRPEGFQFDGDRPVSGQVDGKLVVAEDDTSLVKADTPFAMPGVLPDGFGK